MIGKRILSLVVLGCLSAGPAMAQVNLASELHECRNTNEAAYKIDRCTNVIMHSRNKTQLEIAYNSRGFALMDAGRFDEAANDFSAVISLNPSIAGYYDNRQNAYRRAGRCPEALNDANNAIHMAPNYAFAYRGRANVYNDMGQFQMAISDYNKAIQINPGDGGLFIDRGKILERLGRIPDAITDFSHALELDRKWTAAFRERGLALKQLGQVGPALNDLSIFVELQPGDQEAEAALAELQTARTVNPAPAPMPTANAPVELQQGIRVSSGSPLIRSPDAGSVQISEIALEKNGGTFEIPVSINHALTLNFIIDSGAADVSIPADVVSTLLRTGTLNRQDFLGSENYRLADGTVVPSETFTIRSLRVGDKELENVKGSVAKVEGSLLLGQSFLSRFKSWSLDNERGVLILK